MASTFRDLAYDFSPAYLQGYQGQRYVLVLSMYYDMLGDAAAYAVRARFPLTAPSDALPWLASDRQIDRGPSESVEAYNIRLVAWLDLWRRAGSAASVIGAIAAYSAGLYEVETVAESLTAPSLSSWDVYDPATTQTTNQHVAPANWDWDSRGERGRAWVVIQGGGWTQLGPVWGAFTWGTSSSSACWGFSGNATELPFIRSQIAKWRTAGVRVPWIIMSWDATWFQPTSPAGKLPAGDYGTWGKVVVSGGSRVYVPARTANASYANGEDINEHHV